MKTYSPFNQVFCPNVDYRTAYGLGWIEAEGMILISLPRVEQSLGIDGPLINSSRNSYIDELTARYGVHRLNHPSHR